ncbi:MAG: hypothetical protein GY842_24960 [bacterium]|nr:hypothetical protein [bacterium]
MAAVVPLGCSKPATPPPSSSGALSINVTVVRDLYDESGNRPYAQDKMGYAYNDNHIRGLVNQWINNTEVMFGQEVTISWTGQINTLWTNFTDDPAWEEGVHVEAGYAIDNPYDDFGWVHYCSNQPTPHYNPAKLNIFFVPTILDNATIGQPVELFIDAYAVDPDGNDDPFWQNHAWSWYPVVLVSDYWVSADVTETIIHEDEGPGHPYRLITRDDQYWFNPVFHGVGRYLFRHDDDTQGLWDYYERWRGQGSNYMTHPNLRAEVGILQDEALQRVQNGTWNQP